MLQKPDTKKKIKYQIIKPSPLGWNVKAFFRCLILQSTRPIHVSRCAHILKFYVNDGGIPQSVPLRCELPRRGISVGEGEDYGYVRLELGGVVVLAIGLVAPVVDGFGGGGG